VVNGTFGGLYLGAITASLLGSLHLKGGNAVLAVRPFIARVQEPSKVCILLVPATCTFDKASNGA
jgi:hypothetical protein